MPERRYFDEHISFIKAHYLEYSNEDLAKIMSETFGREFKPLGVRQIKRVYKLTGAPRKEVYSKKFPKEICEFIYTHEKTRHGELREMLSEKFNVQYTTAEIKNFYRNHNLNSGYTGRFEKGHKPANKGKKLIDVLTPEGYERSKASRFKPGHITHNKKTVGTIITTADGYLKIKVAEPNEWEFVHRIIWEDANGPIPDRMKIGFKDADKNNVNINNLFMCSEAECAYMNAKRLRSTNPEATELGHTISKIQIAIKKRRKTNHAADN